MLDGNAGARIPIQVDIGFGDVITPEPVVNRVNRRSYCAPTSIWVPRPGARAPCFSIKFQICLRGPCDIERLVIATH